MFYLLGNSIRFSIPFRLHAWWEGSEQDKQKHIVFEEMRYLVYEEKGDVLCSEPHSENICFNFVARKTTAAHLGAKAQVGLGPSP